MTTSRDFSHCVIAQVFAAKRRSLTEEPKVGSLRLNIKLARQRLPMGMHLADQLPG
jgi:hypothetical protein